MRTRRIAVGVLLLLASMAGADEEAGDWTERVDLIRGDGPAIVRVPLAALILSGRSGGSIGVSVLATPLPSGAAKLRVSVLTAIDGASLPAGDEVGIDVYVYAIDATGAVVGSTTQSLTLRPETLRGRRGLEVLSSLDLHPGDYDLRVLVSHRGGDEIGLEQQRLIVPSMTGDDRSVLTPWLLEPVAPWVIALPAGEDVSPLRPVLFDTELHLPAARPVLAPGARVTGCLLARRPGSPPWQLSARFETGDGLGVEVPLDLRERRWAPWPDLELLLVTFRVPEIPPGDYAMRVAVAPAETAPLVSLPLSVVVEVAESTPRIADRDPDETAEPVGRRPRGRSLPRREVEASYREVLRHLVTGERDAARRALIALEERADRAAPGAVFEELEKFQWHVLSELAASSWSDLLPVVQLHLDLVERYRQRGATVLTEHAIRSSRRLATTLARRAETSDERTDTATALIGLASLLLRAGRLGECEELFARALELDESQTVAHLGLAVSQERRGSYDEAAASLDHLVELWPDHAEGRLRLAVSLARLGKSPRARPLLETLTAVESPEWVGVLAAQEAARLASITGQWQEAFEILERGLGRWPHDAGLAVQRAHLLDRAGQGLEARRSIDQLVARSIRSALETAPRNRYNRWPAEALEAARRDLEARASLRLGALGKALGVRPLGPAAP